MRCPRCRAADLPAAARTCERCGYSLGLPVDDPDIPATLDQWARTELAGLFELGAVVEADSVSIRYLAEDPAAHRSVTVRVFDFNALRQAGLAPAVQNAVVAAGALNHPHIVPVYRSGVTARLLWCAMHRPDGRSLAATLAYGGPLDLATCLGLVEQVSSALHYAHRRGVVHGDVSPGNIEMSDSGWALVTDFGVDRLLRRLPGGMQNRTAIPIAPEAHVTPRITPAADQYGLAATLCECLTGPWPPASDGDSATAFTARDRLSQRVAEARRDLPGSARAALRRALNPNPADRFQSVLEFAAALDVAAEPAAAPAPPPAARAPADLPNEESQPVVFVSGRPTRRAMRVATRVVLLMGVSGLGMTRLFGGERGPPRLAPAVVVAPATTPERAPPIEPPLIDSSGYASGLDPLSDTTGLLPDTFGLSADPADTAVTPAADPVETSTARTRTAPRRDVEDRPRPTPSAPASATPGRLYVSSRPWGQLQVDGVLVGNTPASGIEVTPGTHRVRITREGFVPWEGQVVIESGRDERLVDILLRRIPP